MKRRRVRAEFGYPIMVTPLSQFVGSQAAINVIVGERYKQVTDQTIEYAMGSGAKKAARSWTQRKRKDSQPAARQGDAARPHPSDRSKTCAANTAVQASPMKKCCYAFSPARKSRAHAAAGPPRAYTSLRNPILTSWRISASQAIATASLSRTAVSRYAWKDSERLELY